MVATEYHDAPVWLTESYLEQVLRKYKNNNNLLITNLVIQPATAKGENYASVITRVKVYFKLEASADVQLEHYIVKTSYEHDPHISCVFGKYDIYNTEMLMYEQILPQLTELLEEIGDEDKLFAGTVHVDFDHSAIIFEDLSVSKYTTLDRIKGMDMSNTKLALKKLAKMHATAAVLNERQPGLLTKFDHGMFNRHTRGLTPFFINMMGNCAEFAGDCAELGNYYKQKLLKLMEHLPEHAARVFDVKPGYFHTLNHGDFWINNIMVCFDENSATTIADMKIIDFQFCAWANPAVDLHYFFNTSLQAEQRFEREGELVKYYYDTLTDTLRQLKFTGFTPSLHEFYLQFEADRFLAVTSALASQPLMINDQTEDADFNGVIKDDTRGRRFRKMLYKNSVVQEYMKKLLPMFDAKGLLNVEQ